MATAFYRQRASAEWRPGSFTKNFSWGPIGSGLRRLYEAIRIGFDDVFEDVERNEFRRRLMGFGAPDFIPMNFFLYNYIDKGRDYIKADELVFNAIHREYSSDFDHLALFAFHLSMVGFWSDARKGQNWPAMWAHYFCKEIIGINNKWEFHVASADVIESYLLEETRYKAQGARKVATNLSYLYRIADNSGYSSGRLQRWWIDAVFLCLDRSLWERGNIQPDFTKIDLNDLLDDSDFDGISGIRSLEKDLAKRHMLTLYAACGGPDRFNVDKMRELTELSIPEVQWILASDQEPHNQEPHGAIHPTNINAPKTIPWACAMLAKNAGFIVLDPVELAAMDSADYARKMTRDALERIYERQIRSRYSSEEITKITRE